MESTSTFRSLLKGTTKVKAEVGKFQNLSLELTGDPGSMQELLMTTNAFSTEYSGERQGLITNINVGVRKCISGERMTEIGR